MSKAIENLIEAQKFAMKIRPKVGGFPYFAEVLRQSGVTRNFWSLPSCQSLFLTKDGPVVMQGVPLVSGAVDVPKFNQEALIQALRVDQAGKSTFPEFLAAAWKAGVVSYDVDFTKRVVSYFGCEGEKYEEEYPAVQDFKMNEDELEGSLILERLAEVGKVDAFFEAIDSDDFEKVRQLMRKAGIDSETIQMVIDKMDH